ncbi:VOC family protein [Glaciibacter superstes]|uniref:VOC family protein n=1 Tax=Glaciibacter superstes TaxID=501023 RepID=UPI0003B62468|nr:VOC family protein [Glaciibacter superstes]
MKVDACDVNAYDATPAQTGFGFGIHHVQLAMPAGGEDECRRFYVDLVGLTEVQKPQAMVARGGLWVRADALEIHLGVESDFRPQKKAHPGIRVADPTALDALAERLTAHGIAIEWNDDFPGMRRFHTSDNNGNRLEFLTAL